MCLYVFVCVCMCLYVFVCVCICLYLFVFVCICLYLFVFTFVCLSNVYRRDLFPFVPILLKPQQSLSNLSRLLALLLFAGKPPTTSQMTKLKVPHLFFLFPLFLQSLFRFALFSLLFFLLNVYM